MQKKKKIKIIDTTLRDAHQSLFATRMKTEDMLPIAERIDEVGFFSLEVWGGATFDVCLRFLKEDPWERLRLLRKKIKKTKLQMLLRGQNLVGYRHYPDDIVVKFIENSIKNGIDIFRIFDAVNDIRNMEMPIKSAKKLGAIVEGAISYTVSPVHTIKQFVNIGKELEQLGCDIITIKDMAGLISPKDAYNLVKALKKEVKLPVNLHSHCTSGMAPLSYLRAVDAGVDIIDCALSPLSGGASQPPTETIVEALKGTEFDTELDLELICEIAEYFKGVREKYKDIIDPISERIDNKLLIHQIPGGMLSNLISQLKEQNAMDKYNEVLKETVNVRRDLGYPPLVTPTSQIVGTQAVLNVVTGKKYKLIAKEVKDYIRGLYGKPPGEIDENLKKLAIGDEIPIKCRPADLLEPEWEKSRSAMKDISTNEEDILSYAIFPAVAKKFFEERYKKQEEPSPLPVTFDKLKLKYEGCEYYAELKKIEDKNIIIKLNGEDYNVELAGVDNLTQVKIQDTIYKIEIKDISKNTIKVVVDDKEYEIEIEGLKEDVKVEKEIKVAAEEKIEKTKQEIQKGSITAPMPGRIVKILVRENSIVKRGDVLLTLEAMKMENEITAPHSGKVKKINVTEGLNVQAGDVLLVIET